MKKIYTLFVFILISNFMIAQAPEMMSYQAIIRNASDQLIVNQNVGIRISILQGSETGATVYTETHTEATNDNGLVTLNIGTGSTSDDFSSIDWGNGSYFIKSETDPNGGTNYTIEGTSQLLSVPYALYAKESGSDSGNGSNTPINSSDYNSNFAVADGDTVFAYNSTSGTWSSQSTYNVTGSDIVGSNGNFAVADGDTVFAYNGNSGTWSSQSTYNVTGADIVGSNGNFVIADGDTIYAYNGNSGTWSSQSAYNVNGDGIVGSNGNFAIADGDTVFAYNGDSETWSSQSTYNVIGSSIVGANGNFVIADGDTVYAYNATSGIWSSQSTYNVNGDDVVSSSANEN